MLKEIWWRKREVQQTNWLASAFPLGFALTDFHTAKIKEIYPPCVPNLRGSDLGQSWVLITRFEGKNRERSFLILGL